MKKGLFIFLLFSTVITVVSCGPSMRKTCGKVNKTIKKGTFEAKYATALCYYQNEKYYQANLIFENISSIVIGSDSAENVEYYQAYCHFKMESYFYSAHYFRRFFKKYPRSKNAEEAEFMFSKSLYRSSAPYYLDQQSTYEAITACQNFINKYPNSQYLNESNEIIDELQKKLERKAYENAKLYYKISRYKAAVVTMKSFPDQFPGSDFNEEISYLKFMAQYKLAENSKEIVSEEGKKDVPLKLNRFKEAQEFYQELVDQYPNSKYAKEAKNLYESTLEAIKKLEQ